MDEWSNYVFSKCLQNMVYNQSHCSYLLIYPSGTVLHRAIRKGNYSKLSTDQQGSVFLTRFTSKTGHKALKYYNQEMAQWVACLLHNMRSVIPASTEEPGLPTVSASPELQGRKEGTPSSLATRLTSWLVPGLVGNLVSDRKVESNRTHRVSRWPPHTHRSCSDTGKSRAVISLSHMSLLLCSLCRTGNRSHRL